MLRQSPAKGVRVDLTGLGQLVALHEHLVKALVIDVDAIHIHIGAKVTDSGKTDSAGCSAGDISLAESVIMRTDIANPFLRKSREGNFDSNVPARRTRSNGTMQFLAES